MERNNDGGVLGGPWGKAGSADAEGGLHGLGGVQAGKCTLQGWCPDTTAQVFVTMSKVACAGKPRQAGLHAPVYGLQLPVYGCLQLSSL